MFINHIYIYISVNVSFYLVISVFIRFLIFLSVHLPCLLINPLIYLSIYLPTKLPLYLPTHLSIHTLTSPPSYPFTPLPPHPSFHLSTPLPPYPPIHPLHPLSITYPPLSLPALYPSAPHPRPPRQRASNTHASARLLVAVEERQRHPHDLRLHLPHAREYVCVERVRQRRLAVHLQEDFGEVVVGAREGAAGDLAVLPGVVGWGEEGKEEEK